MYCIATRDVIKLTEGIQKFHTKALFFSKLSTNVVIDSPIKNSASTSIPIAIIIVCPL